MRSQAAKGRKLFSLAAALLVCLLLLAPTAEASRYLPSLTSTTAAPALPALEALDQVDQADTAEPFPLLTDEDAQQLAALALLDAPEIARLTADRRLRPLADPGTIPRPVELAAIRKLASGVSTCWPGLNVWETGGLPQDCIEHAFQGLWTDPSTGIAHARNRWFESRTASWLSEDPKGAVDSPNLYAFVGWGPQAYVDPMGPHIAVTQEAIRRANERPNITPERARLEQVIDRSLAGVMLVFGSYVILSEGGVTGALYGKLLTTLGLEAVQEPLDEGMRDLKRDVEGNQLPLPVPDPANLPDSPTEAAKQLMQPLQGDVNIVSESTQNLGDAVLAGAEAAEKLQNLVQIADSWERFVPEPSDKSSLWESQEKRSTEIYLIRDKEDNVVYVGKTYQQGGTQARFQQHVDLKDWWKQEGYRPEVYMTGYWTPFETATWETRTITEFSSEGAELENKARPITPENFETYRHLHQAFNPEPFG